MATMKADDGHELTYEERVAVMMALGSSEVNARFMLAIQDGEITGDLEDLSEQPTEQEALVKAETTK